MEIKQLITYWNKRYTYITEELNNLAKIYEERHSEFTLEESEVHRSMTDRYNNQLKMVQATVEALEGLNEHT